MNLSLAEHRQQQWRALAARLMPFADAATEDLPIGRLLRLSLFQVSVGIAVVLLNGTLNRIMVVELGMSAWLVSLMVSIPLLFAPLRALIGHRSDTYRSFLGWRRVPFLYAGSMLQFGGLAIMPFALIVMSGDTIGPLWIGPAAAGLSFLLVGAGMHTAQTAGLALAGDLASDRTRPRVVALLYVMLLLGMIAASLGFAALLEDFSQVRLIRVLQGAAVLTLVLNLVALWKQEALNPERTAPDKPRMAFAEAWRAFRGQDRSLRLMVAVALGTLGFSMQDILLEPYGGEILGLSVSDTTGLTALLALGMLVAFWLSSRQLSQGADPARLAGLGALVGVFAFAAVSLAAPLHSPLLFRFGTGLIGCGGGFFAVGTLTAAMALARNGDTGLALGAWGAVQATAAGVAIAAGGALRDTVGGLAEGGALGTALVGPATGYSAVYSLEIIVLFATLIALGPLVRRPGEQIVTQPKFSLAEFPG
jgi:BCD family chlorophyll transporter-like MFS transporter